MEDGVTGGSRPELMGGGLVRSLGGWSQVVSMRRHGDRELSDERILGDGDFVQRILEEAEERQKHQFSSIDRQREMHELIVRTCAEENINLKELQSGSRRRPVSIVRSRLARQLVDDHGVPLPATARELGVSTSAISKITRKGSQGTESALLSACSHTDV